MKTWMLAGGYQVMYESLHMRLQPIQLWRTNRFVVHFYKLILQILRCEVTTFQYARLEFSRYKFLHMLLPVLDPSNFMPMRFVL